MLDFLICVKNSQTKALSVELPVAVDFEGDWDARRRRPVGSAMPAGLWEYVLPTTEAAQMARRPLAESVKDNIDLFVKSKKVQPAMST